MSIKRLINALRLTDCYIETIFLEGGCYKFHLFLAEIFPGSKALINKEKNHIITLLDGDYYDISGEVDGTEYSELSDKDLMLVKSWSFSRTRLISLGECPYCEEPLLV